MVGAELIGFLLCQWLIDVYKETKIEYDLIKNGGNN
jgi:hypothetical protein